MPRIHNEIHHNQFESTPRTRHSGRQPKPKDTPKQQSKDPGSACSIFFARSEIRLLSKDEQRLQNIKQQKENSTEIKNGEQDVEPRRAGE